MKQSLNYHCCQLGDLPTVFCPSVGHTLQSEVGIVNHLVMDTSWCFCFVYVRVHACVCVKLLYIFL